MLYKINIYSQTIDTNEIFHRAINFILFHRMKMFIYFNAQSYDVIASLKFSDFNLYLKIYLENNISLDASSLFFGKHLIFPETLVRTNSVSKKERC